MANLSQVMVKTIYFSLHQCALEHLSMRLYRCMDSLSYEYVIREQSLTNN